MKKIFGIIGILAMFSFAPIANSTSIETSIKLEALSLDCYALAQSYYEYLVEEGVDNREAGRRARGLRDACQEIQ